MAAVERSEIDAVRRFNRLYTKQIGVLNEGLLNSPYSLTEVRVMYELSARDGATATELRRELGIDAGYLSRIVLKFKNSGLISVEPSGSDKREKLLKLTKKGSAEFAPLNEASNKEVREILSRLTHEDRRELTGAMQKIVRLLGLEPASNKPIVLRSHRPGDIGWVTHRHGVLYWQEYGWDEHFEALVGHIAADFVQNFDPKKERCWIAEREGEILGFVFLVKKDASTAKLRMLIVEPRARGLGLGKHLVEECIRFAREVGYKKITLWTQSNLLAARGIYKKAGFKLVAKEKSKELNTMSETWELRSL